MTTEQPNTDELLLKACHRYISITNSDPEKFINELFQLASQAVEHEGEYLIASFSQGNDALEIAIAANA